MSLSAVLWDLDGTLLDTEHLWLAAEQQVMAIHGYTWTENDQEHCLGGPLERVAAYMVERSGTSASAEQIGAELLSAMEALLIAHDPMWRSGVVSLISQMRARQIPLALVTASHRRLLDALDATLETTLAADAGVEAPVFTVTVAGDEVPATKPDPHPYLEAARRLGVSIADCVVIEDSPTGVAAGLASGALVVAVPHMAPISAGPRCEVVASLEDIDLDQIITWLDASTGQNPGSHEAPR